jgi:carboxyl-terminal processing protease
MGKTTKKILETVVAVIAGLALVASGFWLGWSSGRALPENIEVTGVANLAPGEGMNGSSTVGMATPADFSVFWQAWQAIDALYLRNPSTTDAQKVQGAVGGLVDSLGDPYTEYFAPADNTQFQQTLTGDFGGIGAELDVNSQDIIIVVEPLPGTPAATAGLKPNDEIVAINGSSTQTMSVDDAVNMIRGPIGSVVTLSIFRPGAGWTAPRDFKITRADINVPDVQFVMKGDVAVITLDEFTQDSEFEFYQALVKSVQNNAKGIVLDLRNDPGGYLQVAVDISGYFLKPGSLVVKEVGRTVAPETYTASGDGSLANFPLVVLMNQDSASAAEILAGALHDDRGTPLVGTQSFGKGTVQQLVPLSDGSSIKVTVAHWVLPSGEIIDHIGLTPTYLVSSTPMAASGTTIGGANGPASDPQFDKALQVIQQQIGG